MSLHSLYTEPHHPLPKGPLVKKPKTIKTRNTSNSDEASLSVHIQRHRLPRHATTNEPRHTSPIVMRKFMDCMNNLSCFGAGADRPINPNNDGATMNSNNIVPLDVPIGHLEPFETRPVVKLPALPDIKNRKVLREILKVDKKMRDKIEGHSPNQNAVFSDSSGSRFMKAFLKSKVEEPSYARTGVIIMDEVLEDIISSKGADLEYNLQEHIHHYGDWGAVTTKELADVFRGYIGALSSENEIGLKGVHIWLHKLLGKAVINEIEYASWTEKHARQAARMAREGSQYEFDGLSFGLGDGHSAEF
ncbi:hypothetical protein EYR41_008580 [Orbilia oligospora]|uniref:Uncharacterized protein n=1 Tax=Orbilia oligospora TaxID=2813651 RepID=A0A8H2DY99_ORBOL|nr:hypothetical protein EYR41_008580 [Orbilia oligospora]